MSGDAEDPALEKLVTDFRALMKRFSADHYKRGKDDAQYAMRALLSGELPLPESLRPEQVNGEKDVDRSGPAPAREPGKRGPGCPKGFWNRVSPTFKLNWMNNIRAKQGKPLLRELPAHLMPTEWDGTETVRRSRAKR